MHHGPWMLRCCAPYVTPRGQARFAIQAAAAADEVAEVAEAQAAQAAAAAAEAAPRALTPFSFWIHVSAAAPRPPAIGIIHFIQRDLRLSSRPRGLGGCPL